MLKKAYSLIFLLRKVRLDGSIHGVQFSLNKTNHYRLPADCRIAEKGAREDKEDKEDKAQRTDGIIHWIQVYARQYNM